MGGGGGLIRGGGLIGGFTVFLFSIKFAYIVVPAETPSLVTKYASLVVLVLQNASQVLLIRYARTSRPKNELFYPTTAVFFTEMVKLAACLAIVSVQQRGVIR